MISISYISNDLNEVRQNQLLDYFGFGIWLRLAS